MRSRLIFVTIFMLFGLSAGAIVPTLVLILALTILKLPAGLPLVMFEVLKLLFGQTWAAIVF